MLPDGTSDGAATGLAVPGERRNNTGNFGVSEDGREDRRKPGTGAPAFAEVAVTASSVGKAAERLLNQDNVGKATDRLRSQNPSGFNERVTGEDADAMGEDWRIAHELETIESASSLS